jgi:transporter family protein
MWILYALFSALFAGATAILAKMGIQDMPSNLATAIRTAVVLIMAWGLVFLLGQQKGLAALTQKSLWLLIASGVATGLSWLFYFKALQIGRTSHVIAIDKMSLVFGIVLACIFLGEKLDVKTIIGGLLVIGGTFVLIF